MTASYIIAAVMIAPALVQVGIPPTAAHMFIFYYAVLSEVSPPTALSPFAAAALTGARSDEDDAPHLEVHAAGVRGAVHVHVERTRTRPVAAGRGLTCWWAVAVAAVSLACFAAARADGSGGTANPFERAALAVSGVLFMYKTGIAVSLGAIVLAAALSAHFFRPRLAG